MKYLQSSQLSKKLIIVFSLFTFSLGATNSNMIAQTIDTDSITIENNLNIHTAAFYSNATIGVLEGGNAEL